MYTFKPQTQIWRPEFYNKEMHTSLHIYTKKIQKLRSEQPETLQAVHYPSQWH